MKRLLLLILLVTTAFRLFAAEATWSSPPYSTGGGIAITIPSKEGDKTPAATFANESEKVAISSVVQQGKNIVITLVPLESGEIETPEITVKTAQRTVKIAPKKIVIQAVTTKEQTKLADLKKSAIATVEDYFLLWVGLGVLGAILLGLLIYYLIKKRKKNHSVAIRVIPPFEVAMSYYTKAENALQKGDIGKAVDNITIGIRHYLEVRTEEPFLEMTTREVISHYKKADLETSSLDLLQKTLKTGDRYKFAEEHLTHDELSEMLESFSSILQRIEAIFAQKEAEKKAKQEVNDAVS